MPLVHPHKLYPCGVRFTFYALFIKQRLGLTDEETVEQIRENALQESLLKPNSMIN
jgi:hypothetical protein